MRRVVALGAMVLALACLAPPAGKRIDVGGHRLRYLTKGKGSPTVIFDSGMGDSHETWRWVWPEVAEFTTVLLYDRAGLGRSDPGPLPRTSRQIVSELRALLQRAQLRGPYLLVGHSFGALNARLFAGTSPEDVVGLVLVDPTPVDFPTREASLASEEERRRLETLLPLTSATYRDEREAAEQSAEQVRQLPVAAEIPVIVISSRRSGESEEFREAWIEMQRRMARALGAEEHRITSRSGHYVQYDEPHLIVEAIREIVTRVRR